MLVVSQGLALEGGMLDGDGEVLADTGLQGAEHAGGVAVEAGVVHDDMRGQHRQAGDDLRGAQAVDGVLELEQVACTKPRSRPRGADSSRTRVASRKMPSVLGKITATIKIEANASAR